MSEPESPSRPSAMPPSSSGKRRPRYILGTFWAVVALLCFIAGFSGTWWAILVGLGSTAYSIYLYRGGRYGWFFF